MRYENKMFMMKNLHKHVTRFVAVTEHSNAPLALSMARI